MDVIDKYIEYEKYLTETKTRLIKENNVKPTLDNMDLAKKYKGDNNDDFYWSMYNKIKKYFHSLPTKKVRELTKLLPYSYRKVDEFLTKAVRKQKIKKKLVLYRGLQIEDIDSMVKKMKRGAVWMNSGFSSWSFDVKTAMSFADNLLLTVELPVGTEYFYIDGFQSNYCMEIYGSQDKVGLKKKDWKIFPMWNDEDEIMLLNYNNLIAKKKTYSRVRYISDCMEIYEKNNSKGKVNKIKVSEGKVSKKEFTSGGKVKKSKKSNPKKSNKVTIDAVKKQQFYVLELSPTKSIENREIINPMEKIKLKRMIKIIKDL
jgi:hypothetical protein